MLSLYDITVPNYIRMLESVIEVMKKGQQHLSQNELEDVTNMRLAEDMLPFNWQVNITTHNAIGSIKGAFSEEFRPPQTNLENLSYQELVEHVQNAIETLKGFNKSEVDTRFGKPLYFKLSEQTVPFTAENFVMSFATPNVYFHITTIYDMLRIKGVPLSKRDYLGQMAVGIPA